MPENPDADAFKGLDTDFGFQSPFDSEGNGFPDGNEFNHAFDNDFGDTKESKGSSEKKRRPRKPTAGRSVSPSAKEELRSSGTQQTRGVNRNRSGKLKSLQKAVGNTSNRAQGGSVGSGSTDKNDRSFRSKNRQRLEDRRHSRPTNDELGYGDPDHDLKSNRSRSRRHIHDDTGDNNSGRRSRRGTNEEMPTGHDEHSGRRSRHPTNEDHEEHGRKSRGPSNEDDPPSGRRSRRLSNENMGYGGDHQRERSPTHNASDENLSSRSSARIRASQFGSAAAAFKTPQQNEEDQPDNPAPAPARPIRQRPRRRASLVNQVESRVPERGVRASRSGDLRPRMRRGLSGKNFHMSQDHAASEGVSDFPGVAVVSDFPGVSAASARDLHAAEADALPPAELDEWAESRAKKQREMMERFKLKKDQEAAEKAAKEAAEREAAEKAEMEELDLGYDEVEVKETQEVRPRRRASIAGAFGRKKSFTTLEGKEDQSKSKRALKKEEKKKEKEDKKKAKEEKKAAKTRPGNTGEHAVPSVSLTSQPAPARVFADRERRRPGSLLERIGDEEFSKSSSALGFRSEDSSEPSYSDKMLQMLQK